MPKQRYERREPTHEWSQIRPLLKDPTQIHYEILRPIVLFGVSHKERCLGNRRLQDNALLQSETV